MLLLCSQMVADVARHFWACLPADTPEKRDKVRYCVVLFQAHLAFGVLTACVPYHISQVPAWYVPAHMHSFLSSPSSIVQEHALLYMGKMASTSVLNRHTEPQHVLYILLPGGSACSTCGLGAVV